MTALSFFSIPGTRFSAFPAISDKCARFSASVVADDASPICKCGKEMKKHGPVTQIVNDLPFVSLNVMVDVWKMRYRCKSCRVTMMHPVKGLNPHAKVSRRLAARILSEVYKRLSSR